MNRTTLSLGAGVAALVAVAGFASVTATGTSTAGAAAPAQLPVERSTALCPSPGDSETAETTFTSFAPKGAAGSGTAVLSEAAPAPTGDDAAPSPSASKSGKDAGDDKDGKEGGSTASKSPTPSASAGAPAAPRKPVVTLKEPGTPVTKDGGAHPTALVGTATGPFAPGWTTQETTTEDVGAGRGLLGITCTAPDTDLWLPAASTAASRTDYAYLTNPDDSTAVADIQLYGKDGVLKSDVGEGIPVPAHASVPVLLSTLTAQAADDVTVHVTTRSGRVGVALRAADDKTGGDWMPPSADPAPTVVLPGIPGDATDVRLVVFAPGQDDADVDLRLLGPNGGITPAGHETLHVKSGMTAAVDLADLTRGEPGTLVLSPSDKNQATPVVAALRVTRGKGDDQEMGFVPATVPVVKRATVADNRAKGSTLFLAAPTGAATVKVTASAGSGGGTPATKTYTVKAGTVQAVAPVAPQGLKGSYALTVEPQSGAGVYAARALIVPKDGVPMFTIQTVPDDRGTVSVPNARQDLSILDDRH